MKTRNLPRAQRGMPARVALPPLRAAPCRPWRAPVCSLNVRTGDGGWLMTNEGLMPRL
jgi:hypothetical protein